MSDTQLPRSSRSSTLEEIGFAAIRKLFSPDRFRFRDERLCDFGVDASIEILDEVFVTNFRGQIQLKSTEVLRPGRDGSYSLSVTVSSFNYLLNGPSPLYLLYIVPLRTAYYSWAYDEKLRLDREVPGWPGQQTVTIKLESKLDSRALEDVHRRISREGQFHRASQEALAVFQDSVIRPVDTPPQPEMTVHIRMSSSRRTDLLRFRELLMASVGPSPVLFHVGVGANEMCVKSGLRVSAAPQFVAKLMELADRCEATVWLD